MKGAFALAASAILVAVLSPGCDPSLDRVDPTCRTAADCELGAACDPRSNTCVVEPDGYLVGRFGCRVFDDVVPSDGRGTSDVVGTFEGQRIQLQASSRCFAQEIHLEATPKLDGTSVFLVVRLPDGFTGGDVELGPSNAYVKRVPPNAEAVIDYGVAKGAIRVANYRKGATVTGAVVLTPSRGCGNVIGPFCPEGERCAAIFTARLDSGLCTAAPPSDTCTQHQDCRLGQNCVNGTCQDLCGGSSGQSCATGQSCAAVADQNFLARFEGVCAPDDQVAKMRQPCPDGTKCVLGSTCVQLSSGPVCSDFCQTTLSCGGNGYGCVLLQNGEAVCLPNTPTAGDACKDGYCDISSVCLSNDMICHELCNGDSDCPKERPHCLLLQSGEGACGT